MAAKTDGSNSWQPLLGAGPAGLLELGARLRLRRAALGYRHVPAFIRAGGVSLNTRMVGDIEHGRRDTYTFPTLEDVAAAYEVTCDSMVAVAWGKAEELTPGSAAPARRARDDGPGPGGVPPSPFGDPEAEADYPYAARIWQRFVDLAGEGAAVTGALLFPDAPDDAQAWDGIGSRLPVENRVWFIARLRRREADRAAGSEANGTSA